MVFIINTFLCAYNCSSYFIFQSLSSDSQSLSSVSYVSAVCSQEDITLVDLHMQVNRQILESPMLMSSYISHLPQTRCTNWTTSVCDRVASQPAALLQPRPDGRLIYIGGHFVPHMEPLAEGVAPLKLLNREDPKSRTSGTDGSEQWDGKSIADITMEADLNYEEDEVLTAHGEPGIRTAILIRVQGNLDVMITPLLLESLQRFVDAVIPTLVTIHPLTVVHRLHNACIGRVVSANMLKREYGTAWKLHDQSVMGVYEESVRTQTQMAVTLPKINITLLQASVVEEVISFSALDNIKDLTCVSLFAICFENVTARFHNGKQVREVVQIFNRPAVAGHASNKKSSGVVRGPLTFLTSHVTGAATGSGTVEPGEPVYIETSEKQQEEMVISLNIGRVHAQLRRLPNDSSILDDAVITAIPAQHSKVLFTCARSRQNAFVQPVDYYYLTEKYVQKKSTDTRGDQDKLGFIMFECGLEGVSIKVRYIFFTVHFY